MPLLDTNSNLTTKPYNFDIKCKCNSESYDRHSFFVPKFRGGQNFFRTVGGFYNERENPGTDWLVLLIQNKSKMLREKDWKWNAKIKIKRERLKVSLLENIFGIGATIHTLWEIGWSPVCGISILWFLKSLTNWCVWSFWGKLTTQSKVGKHITSHNNIK